MHRIRTDDGYVCICIEMSGQVLISLLHLFEFYFLGRESGSVDLAT